jgi:hypothetical protein
MADINTVKNELNALGYGVAIGGQHPNAPAALKAVVDSNGNLLLNGKADIGLSMALRAFQHAHGLPANGLVGATTVAALDAAYQAKEQAADAIVAQQGAIAAGTSQGSVFIDAATAGQTFDAAGNVTGGSHLDPNDPDVSTAAAQAAQVAGLAAGSVPGRTGMQGLPVDRSLVGAQVPAGMPPALKWGLVAGGVLVIGGLTALIVTKHTN